MANCSLDVSQLPLRVDRITVTLGTKDKERVGVITYRREQGKAVFDELKWMDGVEAEGRFVNLRK